MKSGIRYVEVSSAGSAFFVGGKWAPTALPRRPTSNSPMFGPAASSSRRRATWECGVNYRKYNGSRQDLT